MNKKAYKRYKMSVRSMLPCGRKQKDRIMESFSESLDAYQSENPDASYEEITAHFGTPDEIAATCVENTGTSALLRMLRIRKRIIAIVAGAITAAFLIWAVVLEGYSVALTNLFNLRITYADFKALFSAFELTEILFFDSPDVFFRHR